jgi:hypothetical protein
MADAEKDAAKTQSYGAQSQKVSLNEIDKAGSTAEAADRKIIRNADITIEVPSTTDAQHRVTSIAEAHGGFPFVRLYYCRQDWWPVTCFAARSECAWRRHWRHRRNSDQG